MYICSRVMIKTLFLSTGILSLMGPIDVTLFASPIGWSVGVAVVALLYVAEKEWGDQSWLRFLESPLMACWLLGLTALWCIIGSTIPEWAQFSTSWPFVVTMALLLTHLALVIIHRMRQFATRHDFAFLLTHLGLWIALFSGMAGAGDTKELYAVVGRTQETTSALNKEKERMEPISHSLKLMDFKIETHADNGSPVQYSATIRIDGTDCPLAVNHPYPISWDEDLYLMNYETDSRVGEVSSCLLLLVCQPWKYVSLIGILMLLAGTIWMMSTRNRRRKEARP